MITDFFLSVVSSVFGGVTAAMPSGLGPPDWLAGPGRVWVDLFAYASSMSAWFPLALAVTMANLVLASIVAGSSVKMLRIFISFFTGGGGSAA